jgi:surfactin synthase thioesterase subunit
VQVEVADGGHYFLRTRPAETAEAVLRHTPHRTTGSR